MIKRIERLEDTVIRAGGLGDNWHMTWAKDDKLYAGLCDGTGWPDLKGYDGSSYNSRLYAINGYPPNIAFEHVDGYPYLVNIFDTEFVSRYYGFGIIAIDDCIYQFLSTPNTQFSGESPRFVGAKLIYSPDLGKTWRNSDGSDICWEPWDERNKSNMAFFYEPGEAFQLLTVLQMGRNYEYNKDGYVYVYAPKGNIEGQMNQLVMFRSRKDRLLYRKEYEFFSGFNSVGKPIWNSDINEMIAVCEFPSGWVNTKIHPYAWHPSIVYNAPLDVYMMANWGMGCSADGTWFAKPSYLGFWTAKDPWGPWTQVYEEEEWMPGNDINARAYQPQISPKWISEDGKSFWLVWTDFQSVEMYYAFNLQKVLIHTG